MSRRWVTCSSGVPSSSPRRYADSGSTRRGVLGPPGHDRAGQAVQVDRQPERRRDRRRGGAYGEVVAVAVAAVERDEGVGPQARDHVADLVLDQGRRSAAQRAGRGVAVHAGVEEAERGDLVDPEDAPGLAQLGLAQRAEAAPGHARPGRDLAGLTAGRAQHVDRHAGGAGVEHQRAAAERLVVGVGHHHQHPRGRPTGAAHAAAAGTDMRGLLPAGALWRTCDIRYCTLQYVKIWACPSRDRLPLDLLRPAGAALGPLVDDLRAGPAGAALPALVLRLAPSAGSTTSPRSSRPPVWSPSRRSTSASGAAVTTRSPTRGGPRWPRWLSETPEPRTTEFEAMVKVFFADAGDRDQLLVTLGRIEEESLARVADLRDLAGRPTNFPHRRHLQAIALQGDARRGGAGPHLGPAGRGSRSSGGPPRPTPGPGTRTSRSPRSRRGRAALLGGARGATRATCTGAAAADADGVPPPTDAD